MTSTAPTWCGPPEGSDPALLWNEHVVYVAHVDHFGRGVAMNGDDIYNGAHDNASGVAIVRGGARLRRAAHAAEALGAVPVRDG
ncbi:MAG: M28 family peptidase [Vicinamibacterales bacterium]